MVPFFWGGLFFFFFGGGSFSFSRVFEKVFLFIFFSLVLLHRALVSALLGRKMKQE